MLKRAQAAISSQSAVEIRSRSRNHATLPDQPEDKAENGPKEVKDFHCSPAPRVRPEKCEAVFR